MNLKDLKLQFIGLISEVYEPDECGALFDLTADKLLKISRTQYLTMQSRDIDQELIDQVLITATELSTGKPVQYIFGETVFYGLNFYVNSKVLIPRPETEELVDLIIKTIRKSGDKKNRMLDIGTGTGCIAITLKKQLNNLQVSAMDISDEALQVANRNAELNDVQVNFIHADILSYKTEVLYDIIVSNPPYIKEDEKEFMHQNVVTYEPHLALFVTNEDPLIFYKAIVKFSKTNLTGNGFLFFEINEFLGSQMKQLLEESGYINISVLKDMQGKDRMVCAQYH
jgi:release factor glutamine methyltransferase